MEEKDKKEELEKKAAAEKAAAEKKAAEEAEAAKPSPTEDLISKANAAAARQEEANAELAKLVARQEAMIVEKTLGGTTEAGTGGTEETPKEYAERILTGKEDEPGNA